MHKHKSVPHIHYKVGLNERGYDQMSYGAGVGGYGAGFTGAGAILVLFILLVIVGSAILI
jgi:hypothetical protein